MDNLHVGFELAGFMHQKLPERVHGMKRFCASVSRALLRSPSAVAAAAQFTRVRTLVMVDDVPLPAAEDRVDLDGTAILFLQSVGPRETAHNLFPDFVFGGWWHIGLHDFDNFTAAMASEASLAPENAQAFWIGNTEMHPSRVALVCRP